jgi:hypothetical protein
LVGQIASERTMAKAHKGTKPKRRLKLRVKSKQRVEKPQLSEKQEEAEARQNFRSGELERRFGFKP